MSARLEAIRPMIVPFSPERACVDGDDAAERLLTPADDDTGRPCARTDPFRRDPPMPPGAGCCDVG